MRNGPDARSPGTTLGSASKIASQSIFQFGGGVRSRWYRKCDRSISRPWLNLRSTMGRFAKTFHSSGGRKLICMSITDSSDVGFAALSYASCRKSKPHARSRFRLRVLYGYLTVPELDQRYFWVVILTSPPWHMFVPTHTSLVQITLCFAWRIVWMRIACL